MTSQICSRVCKERYVSSGVHYPKRLSREFAYAIGFTFGWATAEKIVICDIL